MLALRIAYQRYRRLTIRIGALVVLALAGLIATLPTPHADAGEGQGAIADTGGVAALLRSPQRLDSAAFGTLYRDAKDDAAAFRTVAYGPR